VTRRSKCCGSSSRWLLLSHGRRGGRSPRWPREDDDEPERWSSLKLASAWVFFSSFLDGGVAINMCTNNGFFWLFQFFTGTLIPFVALTGLLSRQPALPGPVHVDVQTVEEHGKAVSMQFLEALLPVLDVRARVEEADEDSLRGRHQSHRSLRGNFRRGRSCACARSTLFTRNESVAGSRAALYRLAARLAHSTPAANGRSPAQGPSPGQKSGSLSDKLFTLSPLRYTLRAARCLRAPRDSAKSHRRRVRASGPSRWRRRRASALTRRGSRTHSGTLGFADGTSELFRK